MPDVSDRHADAQLAASRLGARSIEHTGAKYTKLEFTDAALRNSDILPKNSPLMF
jgi:hypothetical protein